MVKELIFSHHSIADFRWAMKEILLEEVRERARRTVSRPGRDWRSGWRGNLGSMWRRTSMSVKRRGRSIETGIGVGV